MDLEKYFLFCEYIQKFNLIDDVAILLKQEMCFRLKLRKIISPFGKFYIQRKPKVIIVNPYLLIMI